MAFNQQQLDMRRPRYPALNIYSSPRVFQQKVNHRSRPLCIYTGPIEANNLTKYYDQRTPEDGYLREVDCSEGLLYQFYQMKTRRVMAVEGSERKEALGLKLLICVCMYNESKNAINLTLEGIYNNLPYLEEQGISAEEVGVVLLQDGILKLVQDRKTRRYAKGSNSMV